MAKHCWHRPSLSTPRLTFLRASSGVSIGEARPSDVIDTCVPLVRALLRCLLREDAVVCNVELKFDPAVDGVASELAVDGVVIDTGRAIEGRCLEESTSKVESLLCHSHLLDSLSHAIP